MNDSNKRVPARHKLEDRDTPEYIAKSAGDRRIADGVRAQFVFDALDGSALAQIGERAKQLLEIQGQKVREARRKTGFTIEEVAHFTGMHFNTIGRIERGDSEAGLAQLLAIATVLKVDLAQLLPYGASVTGDLAQDEEFALIDVLDVHVSAGSGAVNGHAPKVARFAFQRSWLNQLNVKPENARIIRARGDSMADKINDGDVLLVDTSVTRIERDGVYVIELDGLDYVKVLQRDFATGGVQIVSYNPDYKPQLLSPEQAAELRISGRVVWHGGEL